MSILVLRNNSFTTAKLNLIDLRRGFLDQYQLPEVMRDPLEGELLVKTVLQLHEHLNRDYILGGEMFWGTKFGEKPEFVHLFCIFNPYTGNINDNFGNDCIIDDDTRFSYRLRNKKLYSRCTLFECVQIECKHKDISLYLPIVVHYVNRKYVQAFKKTFKKIKRDGLFSRSSVERQVNIWNLFLSLEIKKIEKDK